MSSSTIWCTNSQHSVFNILVTYNDRKTYKEGKYVDVSMQCILPPSAFLKSQS